MDPGAVSRHLYCSICQVRTDRTDMMGSLVLPWLFVNGTTWLYDCLVDRELRWQDVFLEPMRAPCGHSFCKKCIEPWLARSKTCPEDRKPIARLSDLHLDFILANIIGDQMVACPFRLHGGCPFVSQLQYLAAHK